MKHVGTSSNAKDLATQGDLAANLLPYFTGGVRDTTTTTGTGSITLAGSAPAGYRTFASALAANANTAYCIQGDSGQWEVGEGVYASSTLTRVIVSASSNSNALVNFSAGTKNVFALPFYDDLANGALGRQYANSRGFALP